MIRRIIDRCARDEKGATLVEFGFVAPVLCLLLIGGLDVGHTLYLRSALEGVVQKAARDSSLEDGVANGPALDTRVRNRVLRLNNKANVAIRRDAFTSYGQAERVAEQFTDSGTPGDGICNNSEPFVDENNNGVWDASLGRSGQGGAKDAVIYRVTVTYPAMLPLWRFIHGSNNMTVVATTVLRNQPFGDQTRQTPVARTCPA